MNEIFNAIEENDFQRQQLEVPKPDYTNAVNKLYQVAINHTGQSEAVTLALLSAYDGCNFSFSVSDLTGLDLDILGAVLLVIRGRAVNGIEPHEIIEDGENKFSSLQKEKEHLKNEIRYKK